MVLHLCHNNLNSNIGEYSIICGHFFIHTEFCTNSQYILVGEHLNWSINVTELMCTIDGGQLSKFN